METYSCGPCAKTFNGKIPYGAHLASVKHKKKIDESLSIVQELKNCTSNSSTWDEEPFIITFENAYMCTLCKIYLNSMDQVKCHIKGTKHMKAKSSLNVNIDQTDGNFVSSVTNVADFPSRPYQYIDEVKGSVKNIKVFKPHDEIMFQLGCY